MRKDRGHNSGATCTLCAGNGAANRNDLTPGQDQAPQTRKILGIVSGNSRPLCTSTTNTTTTNDTTYAKAPSPRTCNRPLSLQSRAQNLTPSSSFNNHQVSATYNSQFAQHTYASSPSTSKTASLQLHCGYPRTKKPRIPATDHQQTSILWHRVMVEKKKYLQPTQASKAKAKADDETSERTNKGKQTLRPGAPSRSDTMSIVTDKSPASELTGDSKPKGNHTNLDNPKFRELVLLPRCISIDSDPLSRSAFQHFQTSHPTEMSPPLARYQDIPGLESTTVGLKGIKGSRPTSSINTKR